MNEQIKMFINNEEVVSDKEFTINEEMLSASSTILNNCYPKSWELVKDYTSDFYYPKDYSKFILAQGNFANGNEEYSILQTSGASPSYNTNVEKEWNTFNIYGNSYQATRNGLNLLNNVAVGKVQNGVTFIVNKDKTVSISSSTGATANTFLRLQENFTLAPGHYYMKGGYASNTTFVALQILHTDSTYTPVQASSAGSKAFDIVEGDIINFMQVRVGSGWSGTYTFYPMITTSLDTSYEPYGVSPSPSYPSEIINIGYQNIFDKSKAADFSTGASKDEIDNGIKAINTRNANYNYVGIILGQSELLGKTLTLSANIMPSASNTGLLRVWFGNSTTAAVQTISDNLNSSGSTTFTIPNGFPNNTDRIYLLAYANVSGTVLIGDYVEYTNLQITEGSNQLSYIPYSKYGIEINANNNKTLYILNEPLRAIGDTKDRLYIENGDLIVERKIGKIILDGTENWTVNSTNQTGKYRNCTDLSILTNDNYIRPANNYTLPKILCNYYKAAIAGSPGTYAANEGFSLNQGDLIMIYDNTYNTNDVSLYQNWLSTHNLEVQYIMNTPTIENLGKVNLPSSYKEQNNVSLGVGILSTTIDIYYYWKNFDILFAGIVKNSGEISLNPRYPHYCSLQILDYKTFLSESDTLDFVISNQTVQEAIAMVINAVSGYGFIVGNIDISQANDWIGAYSTLNKTAYDVLQYLADITGSRWRARYVDSSTMAIDFYDPDTLPQGQDIEYNTSYWEDNNIVDLTFNYGTRDYRNKQIILSDEVYAEIDYTEILLSNGYNTTFIVGQNIGTINSITINGISKDVITETEKELGADGDFVYTPGKNTIEASTTYTAGTQIVVSYIPLVKGRQIVFNDAEVARIATQTNTVGVISRYESRNDIVSSKELEQIGETYIEFKGKPEIILTLTTQNKDLYNVGEVVYFQAPIPELAQKYMVKTKKTEYVVINKIINLFYVYELTSSFNSEKAINYFDNQRNKAQGNIQEGESITRNVDINNSATIIWNNATVEEITITVDGNNALNSVLNSPFIE